MKVGYIGLGTLGGPIARRLARSGFEVIACDISRAALDAFDEPGCERSGDPIDTARESDAVGVCVRTDEQLKALAGDGALFDAIGPGGLFMLNSTVAPSLARELAIKADAARVDFVDVGVSGGGPPALEGRLSLFVGASDAALEHARPLLEAMGRIAHFGPPGKGQEAKLLNNLISIANYGMSAAIMELGERLGFDPDQLRDALMAGSAQSFALTVAPGFLKPRDPEGHGMRALRDLLEKDVNLASKLIEGDDLSMEALLAAARHLLAMLAREIARLD